MYNSPIPCTKTGVDNNPFPSLLLPETCTETSVESEQDVDGNSSLCSHFLFTQEEADTVADAQATSVVESM